MSPGARTARIAGALVAVVCLWVPAAPGPAGSPESAGAAAPDEILDLLLPEGGESHEIDLLEALRLAERQSLEVRRADARTRIAAGEAREAFLEWIPELTASAGRGRTDGQVQGSFGDFRDVDFRTVAPFGRLALGINPAQTWFGAAAAARREESAGEQERAVRRLVLVRTSELYHDLLRERAGVSISRMAVEDARDLLQIAEVLLRQGMGRGDDAERARAELANAEQRLIEARRRFHRASINLATALSLDPAVLLVPAEDSVVAKTLVPLEEGFAPILQRALEARPEIAAARRLLSARRSDRAGVVAALASPRLELFYQEGSTGESYDDLSGLRRYGATATWSVSVSGMRRVRTAADRLEESALALEQAEREVRADVLAAWVDAQSAAARIEKAQRARLAAEATLRISQIRFRNGTSLAIEVLQAEQALEQARLSEIAALADYNQAQVRLRAQAEAVAPADLAGS